MEHIRTTSHHPGPSAAASSSPVSTIWRYGAPQAYMAAICLNLDKGRILSYVSQRRSHVRTRCEFSHCIPKPPASTFIVGVRTGPLVRARGSLSSVNRGFQPQRLDFRVLISLSTCRSIYRSSERSCSDGLETRSVVAAFGGSFRGPFRVDKAKGFFQISTRFWKLSCIDSKSGLLIDKLGEPMV
jgi:hypothetical protein